MRPPLLIVFALSLAACQSPPQKADSDPATTPKPSAPAAREASKSACTAAPLQTELASYCEFDLGVPSLELAQVRWTADVYHPLATRVITIDNDGLDDPEGHGIVSIQAWLTNPPRRLPEPGEMVFAIAADVPATVVAELQRGLADAGRREVRYLVHVADGKPLPQPHNPTTLATMREALPDDANERVMFVAKAVQGYAETCPPVASVFPRLAQVAPGDRCSTLAELASTAIVECGCAKLDEIMTLLYASTVGFDVPKGRAAAVPVVLDPDHTIAVAKNTSWGEIANQQFTSTDLHHLWISDPFE